MTYKINNTTVIEDNGDAKFTQLTVTGGSIFLPDVNPTRNTVGYKLNSQTNIDTSGRGVHSKVIIDAASPSNFAIVGSSKSSGYAAGGVGIGVNSGQFPFGGLASNFAVGDHHFAFINRFPINFSGAPVFVPNRTATTELFSLSTSSSVNKFPFSNESNNSLINSLEVPAAFASGTSSETTAYTFAGTSLLDFDGLMSTLRDFPSFTSPVNAYHHLPNYLQGFVDRVNISTVQGIFQKFTFSSDISGSLISSTNTPLTKFGMMGYQSQTRGYTFGGVPQLPSAFNPPSVTVLSSSDMSRFPFSTEVISLTGISSPSGTSFGSNVNSAESGYIFGGHRLYGTIQYNPNIPFSLLTSMIKFPFATETYTVTNSSLPLGDSRAYQHTHQSPTHGYSSGGINDVVTPDEATTYSIRRRKFAFASDNTILSVANLSEELYTRFATQSSDASGYIDLRRMTPVTPSFARDTVVRQRMKFPFASDSDAADNGGFVDFGIAGAVGFSGG
jgi:hypothetical protein